MDGYMEDRGLTGEFLVRVIAGEMGLDVTALAGLHADDAFREAGDEVVLVDFGRAVLGFPTLKRGALDRTFVIDRGDVAELHRAVDRNEDRGIAAQALEGGLDVGIADGDRGTGEFDALVLFELDRRADGDRGPDAKGGALLLAGQELHLRLVHGEEVVFLEGLRIGARDERVHCPLLDRARAVLRLEDLPRDLAGAEARQLDVPGQFAEGALTGGIELVQRNRDLEFDLGRVEVLDGGGAHAARPLIRMKVERKTRFELATLALARRCSTTELLPQYKGRIGGTSWASRDSNSDGLPHWNLNPARLPIPPF